MIRQLEQAGNPGLLAELIADFAVDSRKAIANIKQALDAGDGEKLRKEFHALSSMSGAIGASLLQALASTLEAKASHGGAAACAQSLEQLCRECETANAELRNRLEAKA